MQAVLDILAARGLVRQAAPGAPPALAEEHFAIRVENPPYMLLCIEHIGEGPQGFPAISVAHYGEQNGDLMRDPEMIFELAINARTGAPALYPYYFRNDYAGYEQTAVWRDDSANGRVMCRPAAKLDMEQFARDTWDANIRDQGFIEVAALQAFEGEGGKT